MGEDDFRDLREEVRGLTECYSVPTSLITVMAAEVHSDLRVGNRGWIIGPKTEIEKMRKQLMEAQNRELLDPVLWELTGRRADYYNSPRISMWSYLDDAWSRRYYMAHDPVWGKEAKKSDPINPDHYKSSKIEPIDYMRDQMTEEEFRGFLKGNIIKYTSRAEKKGGKDDYKKAAWYADKLAKL